jgi:hypothetical protein
MLAGGLLLRGEDEKGRVKDFSVFPPDTAPESEASLELTLLPGCKAYWPLFIPSRHPGDVFVSLETGRVLYNEAAVYRNAVGRIRFSPGLRASSWNCRLIVYYTADKWLLADFWYNGTKARRQRVAQY